MNQHPRLCQWAIQKAQQGRVGQKVSQFVQWLQQQGFPHAGDVRPGAGFGESRRLTYGDRLHRTADFHVPGSGEASRRMQNQQPWSSVNDRNSMDGYLGFEEHKRLKHWGGPNRALDYSGPGAPSWRVSKDMPSARSWSSPRADLRTGWQAFPNSDDGRPAYDSFDKDAGQRLLGRAEHNHLTEGDRLHRASEYHGPGGLSGRVSKEMPSHEYWSSPSAHGSRGRTLGFGKYKGFTYEEVLSQDRDYCLWAMQQSKLEGTSSGMLEFAWWLMGLSDLRPAAAQ